MLRFATTSPDIPRHKSGHAQPVHAARPLLKEDYPPAEFPAAAELVDRRDPDTSASCSARNTKDPAQAPQTRSGRSTPPLAVNLPQVPHDPGDGGEPAQNAACTRCGSPSPGPCRALHPEFRQHIDHTPLQTAAAMAYRTMFAWCILPFGRQKNMIHRRGSRGRREKQFGDLRFEILCGALRPLR